jgi:hypothetical protein
MLLDDVNCLGLDCFHLILDFPLEGEFAILIYKITQKKIHKLMRQIIFAQKLIKLRIFYSLCVWVVVGVD